MSIKNLKSTGTLKGTGDKKPDLISQVPSERIPFQLKKIHLTLSQGLPGENHWAFQAENGSKES